LLFNFGYLWQFRGFLAIFFDPRSSVSIRGGFVFPLTAIPTTMAIPAITAIMAMRSPCHPEPLETMQGVESVPKDPCTPSFKSLRQGVLRRSWQFWQSS
jgi:hypothetical protein